MDSTKELSIRCMLLRCYKNKLHSAVLSHILWLKKIENILAVTSLCVFGGTLDQIGRIRCYNDELFSIINELEKAGQHYMIQIMFID